MAPSTTKSLLTAVLPVCVHVTVCINSSQPVCSRSTCMAYTRLDTVSRLTAARSGGGAIERLCVGGRSCTSPSPSPSASTGA